MTITSRTPDVLIRARISLNATPGVPVVPLPVTSETFCVPVSVAREVEQRKIACAVEQLFEISKQPVAGDAFCPLLAFEVRLPVLVAADQRGERRLWS